MNTFLAPASMTFNVTVHKEWTFPVESDNEADAEQLALQYSLIEHASNTTVDVQRTSKGELAAGDEERMDQTKYP
jgi:hypothetical protein